MYKAYRHGLYKKSITELNSIHWIPTQEKGFPDSSAGKESACNMGDLGSISGLWRSPGEGKGYPLQYSDLENSMNCIVHGVARSWTQLSNFHFTQRKNYDPLLRLVNKNAFYCSKLKCLRMHIFLYGFPL